MKFKSPRFAALSGVIAGLVVSLIGISESQAFRMLQYSNATDGRVFLNPAHVACDDLNGFTHRSDISVDWYHNAGGVGAGKAQALQNAMASWNAVPAVDHSHTYVAEDNAAAFVTDGQNSLLWANQLGQFQPFPLCGTTPCVALTALELDPNQVIIETDIIFNSANYIWSTNGVVGGTTFDVENVAAHELGHALGIGHATASSSTMHQTVTGLSKRTLEQDDKDALVCSARRYGENLREVGFGSDVMKLENFGSEEKLIGVTLTGDITGPVDVHFTATNGTTSNSDWGLLTASPLHWDVGSPATQFITVLVVNDSTPENDEYLTLKLTSSTDAILADTSVRLTIICNDGYNCP